ncbi:MAG: hypothetical protein Kow0092_32270 [Deferrisomatales bacterium]
MEAAFRPFRPFRPFRWLAAAAVALVGTSAAASPISWTYGGQVHTYDLFVQAEMGWDEAAASLPAGWYLATVTSQDEQDFLLATVLADVAEGQYWLGGVQAEGEPEPDRSWSWVTGEPWGYESWARGEPNDYWDADPGENSERYLGLWFFQEPVDPQGWKWNDEGQPGNIAGYLAETHAPVPLPPSALLLGSALACLGPIGRKLRRPALRDPSDG